MPHRLSEVKWLDVSLWWEGWGEETGAMKCVWRRGCVRSGQAAEVPAYLPTYLPRKIAEAAGVRRISVELGVWDGLVPVPSGTGMGWALGSRLGTYYMQETNMGRGLDVSMVW